VIRKMVWKVENMFMSVRKGKRELKGFWELVKCVRIWRIRL